MRCNNCWRKIQASCPATLLLCKHIYCNNCIQKIEKQSFCIRCKKHVNLNKDSYRKSTLLLPVINTSNLVSFPFTELLRSLENTINIRDFQYSEEQEFLHQVAIKRIQERETALRNLTSNIETLRLEIKNQQKNIDSLTRSKAKISSNMKRLHSEYKRVKTQNEKLRSYISNKSDKVKSMKGYIPRKTTRILSNEISPSKIKTSDRSLQKGKAKRISHKFENDTSSPDEYYGKKYDSINKDRESSITKIFDSFKQEEDEKFVSDNHKDLDNNKYISTKKNKNRDVVDTGVDRECEPIAKCGKKIMNKNNMSKISLKSLFNRSKVTTSSSSNSISFLRNNKTSFFGHITK